MLPTTNLINGQFYQGTDANKNIFTYISSDNRWDRVEKVIISEYLENEVEYIKGIKQTSGLFDKWEEEIFIATASQTDFTFASLSNFDITSGVPINNDTVFVYVETGVATDVYAQYAIFNNGTNSGTSPFGVGTTLFTNSADSDTGVAEKLKFATGITENVRVKIRYLAETDHDCINGVEYAVTIDQNEFYVSDLINIDDNVRVVLSGTDILLYTDNSTVEETIDISGMDRFVSLALFIKEDTTNYAIDLNINNTEYSNTLAQDETFMLQIVSFDSDLLSMIYNTGDKRHLENVVEYSNRLGYFWMV